MRYDEVLAGRYNARALRARSGVSLKKQTPYIEVEFHVSSLDVTLRWTGYLTEKTIDKTLEVMQLLEWNDDHEFKDGSINTNKDVVIVVTREVGTDGKERPRIQWVNAPGGQKWEGLEPSESKSAFEKLDLKARMAELRAREPKRAAPKNFAPGADDDDTLPF
jgi:hypothetical protein